ncbi:glycerophosphodiester phosphodiesterase [Oceanobacillus salinisoli]|uniref:glycerophosphodiester phosphodiesterase n=1 Tax=Oceanobacillus salinisoli TaxID=2678611 RepID=UPI0012E112B8|nr:glycerophosphodiester phosphodiesterase [Oceanobacillus salinisoli]
MTTKIFAHRGASKYAPENTLPAFELVYQMKADGIETDVQLTKDNVPILIHDEHVKRTTNGRGYVKDLTFAQLKTLDAGSWFSKKYSNTQLPSLKEFLDWAKHKPLYLNIELKNNKIDYKDLEMIVYEMLKEYQLLERTTLSTFNPESVKRMKDINRSIGVAFLTSKKNKHLIYDAKELGANAIHIKYRLLNQLLVDEAHQKKMKVRVYTVNKYPSIKRCFDVGCDGIFTDVPDIAFKYKQEKF